MKYVKVLGLLEKKSLYGYYNPKRNVVVIDFSEGMFHAILWSYHEFLHKIFDVLPVEDWLDLLDPLLRPSFIKKPRRWIGLVRSIFFKKHQDYFPFEDEQRVRE